MAITEIDAPVAWAFYLLTGIDCDLSPDEVQAVDAWQNRELPPGATVIGAIEESERFTWAYRMHGGNADGGNVCTYQILAPE